MWGVVKSCLNPFPTPFHRGVLPFAFSMTDLSTIVLRGETKKPDKNPDKISHYSGIAL